MTNNDQVVLAMRDDLELKALALRFPYAEVLRGALQPEEERVSADGSEVERVYSVSASAATAFSSLVGGDALAAPEMTGALREVAERVFAKGAAFSDQEARRDPTLDLPAEAAKLEHAVAPANDEARRVRAQEVFVGGPTVGRDAVGYLVRRVTVTSPDERLTMDHALATYGFLIARNEQISLTQFADRISAAYDVSVPQNRVIVDTLRACAAHSTAPDTASRLDRDMSDNDSPGLSI
ncbi:hypothetical protein [Burkholderia arboris]|uniref:hypothetical protein n=1 Tax=Burkholderia arboris TaxID=488730 RepID=UPI001CF5BCD3|nr:hypothetical protein [Burkholderia arboris]MCA8050724.1 hypothetical protein [Burkholderia arboris]